MPGRSGKKPTISRAKVARSSKTTPAKSSKPEPVESAVEEATQPPAAAAAKASESLPSMNSSQPVEPTEAEPVSKPAEPVQRNKRGYLDSWPRESPPIVKSDTEVRSAESMINDFRMYASHIRYVMDHERKAISKIPKPDRDLIGDPREHWTDVVAGATKNQKVLDDSLDFAIKSFGERSPIAQAMKFHQPRLSDDDRMSKIRSLFKQLVRDWSDEGEDERNSCYSRVLQGLQDKYPNPDERPKIQIVVPGAGLSRLAWEIRQLGFSTLANENDFSMVVMANYMLNGKLKKNALTIAPYVVDRLNCWAYEDQVRRVTLPDINMSASELLIRKNSFGFAMGDFVQAFNDGEKFDSVVTVFFLDTAKNPIQYIRTVHKILKPGGVWFNFGPLLYHYADMPANESIELPFEKLIEIIEKIGFHIDRVEGPGENNPAYYTRNSKSMLTYSYDCGYFECVKA